MMLSNHHILCCPLSFCLQFFPASVPFPMSWLFASDVQRIGASASVLPIYIQSWFPLGLTGLISLQFKGLSRIFSSTTILLYGPTLTSIHDYWKKELTVPIAGKDAKQQELSFITDWECKMVQPFWKRVWKVLTMLNMLFLTIYKCSIKYLHSFENLYPCKILHGDVYRSFLHNHCFWKQPWCPSINARVSKLWYSHIVEYYKKEWPVKLCTDQDEFKMQIAKWKKPVWKGHILYDSTYMIFWKRQKYGDSKQINMPGIEVGEELNKWSRGFFTVVQFCYDIVFYMMVFI